MRGRGWGRVKLDPSEELHAAAFGFSSLIIAEFLLVFRGGHTEPDAQRHPAHVTGSGRLGANHWSITRLMEIKLSSIFNVTRFLWVQLLKNDDFCNYCLIFAVFMIMWSTSLKQRRWFLPSNMSPPEGATSWLPFSFMVDLNVNKYTNKYKNNLFLEVK